MLFLVAALMLLGVFLGAAVHMPLPVALAMAAAITGWLVFYGVRKRYAHGRRS
ncbi:hypothetical protein ACFYYR_26790 [Streptomyces sp. NPDC001922]|uniref:hypothetical protein n=1 Tax=unclassified Streptomyces TaxID=2593676 RepID=UPI003687BDD4